MIAATFLVLSSIAIAASSNLHFPQFNNLKQIQNEGSYKIIHGIPTDILHHPYQAAIYSEGTLYFSGAILNKNWIISTTTLPDPSYLKVAVGTTKLSEQANRMEVEKVIIHPDWCGGTDYNLSLLKLKTPLKFSKKVQNISIASETPKPESAAVVTGWGSNTTGSDVPSNNLLMANLSIIDKKTCKEAYIASIASNTAICGMKNPATIGYNRDYGAPLVQDGKLVGVFIDYITDEGYCLDIAFCPVLFTDVTLFKQWVENIIKEE
ncbi:trypsin-3-like isoform X2 [Lycorma delicatula]|uniref:trypsin-3-like isoform X2 n=1 Tax=Lycorma delicatula TaxID=130591 RepID=UPI003F519EDB